MTRSKLKLVVATSAALIAQIALPMFGGVAHASPPQFTQSYVRLNRLQELTVTGGTVCAQTATGGTEASVMVTFPTQVGTNFIVNPTAGNWTVTTTNLPVGATPWPGIGTATTVAGQAVTFPSTALTSATLYCFNFAAELTNGSAGNSLTGIIDTLDGSSAIIDETNYAVALITNDQITVSAIVPPTFVFALSGNTDNFGSDLDPATIKSTAGRTVSITTNAKGGWIGWVKDSNAGLTSVAAAYTIPTSTTGGAGVSTLATNSEGYVLAAELTTDAAGGCTVAIAAEYHSLLTTDGGTLDKNVFQKFADCTGTPPATSNGDVITLIERASIAGGTPAGSDYSDIITVVAAGNF